MHGEMKTVITAGLLLFALAAWLFVQAVFFTVKLM